MSPCRKKKCYVILKCTFFVYLFIWFKVTVQIRGISVTQQFSHRIFRRTGHSKAKRCNTQRLKRNNNVIQLEGTHKTLKKQDKTSLKTRYADASQNTRCRRRRHTDVVPVTSDKGACKTLKGMTTTHSAALSPLIKAFYCNKWYPVRLGADSPTLFLI